MDRLYWWSLGVVIVCAIAMWAVLILCGRRVRQNAQGKGLRCPECSDVLRRVLPLAMLARCPQCCRVYEIERKLG